MTTTTCDLCHTPIPPPVPRVSFTPVFPNHHTALGPDTLDVCSSCLARLPLTVALTAEAARALLLTVPSPCPS